ncbi:MAG: homoserine dehydrogenase [Candidatus Bathyarchaeia archaeon]
MELSIQAGVLFRFSGTVGGGTPILDFIRGTAMIDEVKSLSAILNGTTNYILSKMHDEGISMYEALRQAQLLGYVESDYALDIDGVDPALKLSIIANYSLNRTVTLRDMRITGIRSVSLDDIIRCKRSGRKLKLLCRLDDDLTVGPEPVETSQPICVDGPLNAVQLKTEYAGDLTLIGPGAGGQQAATAIIRDLIHIDRAARHN